MKAPYLNRRILIISILLLHIFLFQCTIYRSISYKPTTEIEPFENWNIQIKVDADVDDFDESNYFYVSFCVTTYAAYEAPYKYGWGDVYKDSDYLAKIKSFKLYYGDNFNHEISSQFQQIDTSWAPANKRICLASIPYIQLPGSTKVLKIITEIEYLHNGTSILKEYSILLRRHNQFFPFFITV